MAQRPGRSAHRTRWGGLRMPAWASVEPTRATCSSRVSMHVNIDTRQPHCCLPVRVELCALGSVVAAGSRLARSDTSVYGQAVVRIATSQCIVAYVAHEDSEESEDARRSKVSSCTEESWPTASPPTRQTTPSVHFTPWGSMRRAPPKDKWPCRWAFAEGHVAQHVSERLSQSGVSTTRRG